MDNRHSHRNQLVEYLDILDAKTGAHLGYLGDISTDGLMFISPDEHTVGDHFQVKIPLEEELLERLNAINPGPEVTLPALLGQIEVRWSKPNINPQQHCFGCTFHQVESDHLELIELLAKCLGVDGRFVLHRT